MEKETTGVQTSSENPKAHLVNCRPTRWLWSPRGSNGRRLHRWSKTAQIPACMCACVTGRCEVASWVAAASRRIPICGPSCVSRNDGRIGGLQNSGKHMYSSAICRAMSRPLKRLGRFRQKSYRRPSCRRVGNVARYCPFRLRLVPRAVGCPGDRSGRCCMDRPWKSVDCAAEWTGDGIWGAVVPCAPREQQAAVSTHPLAPLRCRRLR